MFEFAVTGFITSLVSGSYNVISMFIKSYGYTAIFVLMALEASSIPVPSEVVLPIAGVFAATGQLNFAIALVVSIVGSVFGSLVDYAIGYYIGKDVVYKHLALFHVKKETLDGFDMWFKRNGNAAVFLTRLVPIVRTFINFPAGFAKMSLKRFLAYSVIGMLIWDTVLMGFGFYLQKTAANNIVIAMAAVGVFAILLYVVYRLAMKRMKR
jgi:membrane protein DedA with SNARE-associated domain